MSTRFQWTAKGDGTSWDDRKNWSPEDVPKEADIAVIGPVTPDKRLPAVRLRGDVVVDGLELKGDQASISGGTMTVRSEFRWEGGSVFTPLTVRGSMTVTGPFANSLRGRNGSTGITVHGSAVIDTTTLDFSEGATLTSLGSCRIVAPSVLRWRGGGVPPEFVSEGTLLVAGPPIVLARQTEAAAAAGPVAFGPVAAVVDGVTTTIRGQVDATAGSLELRTGHHAIEAALDATLEVKKGATLTLRGNVRVGTRGRLVVAGGALKGAGKTIDGPGRVVWSEGDLYAPLTLGPGTTLEVPAGAGHRMLRGTRGATGDVIVAGDIVTGAASLRIIEGAALVSRGTLRPGGEVKVSTGRPMVLHGTTSFRVAEPPTVGDRLTVDGPLEVRGDVVVSGYAPLPTPSDAPTALPVVLATARRLTGSPQGAVPPGWQHLAVVADEESDQLRLGYRRQLRVVADKSLLGTQPAASLDEIGRRVGSTDKARLAAPAAVYGSMKEFTDAVNTARGADHLVLVAHGSPGHLEIEGHMVSLAKLAKAFPWPVFDTVTIRACNVAQKPAEVDAFRRAIGARRLIASNRFWIWRTFTFGAGAPADLIRKTLAHHEPYLMPDTEPIERLAGQPTARTLVVGWFSPARYKELPQGAKPPRYHLESSAKRVTVANPADAEKVAAEEDLPAGIPFRIYTFQ